MDWDLWSASYDPEENSLCTPLEWLFDFCFHYGLDVIEEDALKEKCCIQVLRILITKADTEIDELEQDLIFLQSELAWIENEEWSEIGYNALTEKIDSLDTSMKSLRNEDVDAVQVHLLMHAQPVERLHEIFQPLLSNYFCKKDLQPANADVKDSSFHPLKLEAGFSAEGLKANSFCPFSIQKGKRSKSGFDSKQQTVMQNLSSSYADMERQNAENLEIQPTNVGVNNAISDASKHADVSSNMLKKSSNSDSQIASGDDEKHSSISAAGLISGSSVKPMVIKTDPGEKVKDVVFDEDVTAEELKCLNELNENGNADQGLCISSDPICQEGLFDFTSNGTDGPTTKELHEGLFDFTSNESDEPSMKDLEVAAPEIAISLNSSERAEKKEKNPMQILKVVEAALTEKESCALTLLLEQQNKKGNDALMVQPKEEDKNMPEVETSVIAAPEKKLNSNMPPDPPQDLQKEKIKGRINSSQLNFHQVGITRMIVDSSSSFVMKGKKRQKSVARPGSYPEWKAIKKVDEVVKCEIGENGASPDEKQSSVTLPSKKTKKNMNIPLISELQSDTTEGDPTGKVLSICDSGSESVQPIPPYAIMEKMKVPELRKIAKDHKMSKYSQLNKRELLQRLACRNGGN